MEVVQRLRERFPQAVQEVYEHRGQVTVVVDRGALLEVMRALRDEWGFGFLEDLCGVDRSGLDPEGPRFEVVYHLVCMDRRERLRVKVRVEEADPRVPSVTPLWATAGFHERECAEMFGIAFDGHEGLKPLLLWEGFPGHPLRKDFPLRGVEES